MAKIGRLLAWVLVAFLPAALSARIEARDYYAGLAKPAWAPPGWLFAPVWSLLYAAMAAAAWIVTERPGRSRGPIGLWVAQLSLNAGYSPIFFGLRAPGLALAEVVALWIAVAATTVVFWTRSRLAGALLLPYLVWVTFATALNADIWRRNR